MEVAKKSNWVMVFVRKLSFWVRSRLWWIVGGFLAIFGFARREGFTTVFSKDEECTRTWLRHKQFVEFLQEANLTGLKVLDVGCGKQELLLRLQKTGKFDGFEGCDWIPVSGNLSYQGIDYSCVDLNKQGLSKYPDNSYDLIISSEVLEHLENPSLVLREINKKLKNGGSFVLSIPNACNIYERWTFFCTGNSNRYQIEKPGEYGHITFYTPNIIMSLASRNGFKIEKQGKGYFYISGFFFFPKVKFSSLFSYCTYYHLRKTSNA